MILICNRWFISLSRGNELDEGRKHVYFRSAISNTFHWNSQLLILKRTRLTSEGGTVAPIYVHGLSATTEFGWDSKDGNLSFSTSRTAVVAVGGEVVDKTHCVRKHIDSLCFAADSAKKSWERNK